MTQWKGKRRSETGDFAKWTLRISYEVRFRHRLAELLSAAREGQNSWTCR